MTPESGDSNSFLKPVEEFFSAKMKEHGPNLKGLDYSTEVSQTLRFDQLIKLLPRDRRFSLMDYGCGLGTLAPYMEERGYQFDYEGYDLSPVIIDEAAKLHSGRPEWKFFSEVSQIGKYDFLIACGVLNMKLDTSEEKWKQFILDTLHQFDSYASQGFAFNMLSVWAEFRRPDLYYGDPTFFFDYCKRNFGRNVALFHDYMPHDWTIIVRKV